MNSSAGYNVVKRYYDKGIYTKENVREFVNKSVITPEEYEMITNEPFEA